MPMMVFVLRKSFRRILNFLVFLVHRKKRERTSKTRPPKTMKPENACKGHVVSLWTMISPKGRKWFPYLSRSARWATWERLWFAFDIILRLSSPSVLLLREAGVRPPLRGGLEPEPG